MDRQAFLARLAPRPGLPVPQAPPRPGPAQGDLTEMLLTNLQAGGCGLHRATGAQAALAAVLAIMKEAGVTRAGHAGLPPEMLEILPALAQEAGLDMLHLPDGLEGAPALGEPLAAGLTVCEMAVAQTGGLVQLSGPQGGRLLSLLPPLHVALLHASAILPDMAALAATLADAGRFPQGPPACALISGPSKTADIEGVMIRGVHGPGRVEVVLWS
ncbi:MAG: LUD domain-containing protein [Desulfarculus sp.]|nr:LUD domain-containing protein [Desulfarculus sp.]